MTHCCIAAFCGLQALSYKFQSPEFWQRHWVYVINFAKPVSKMIVAF